MTSTTTMTVTPTAANTSRSTTRVSFGTTTSVAGRFGYVWTDTGPDDAGTSDSDGGGPVVIGSGWTENAEELLALIHPTLLPAGQPVAFGGHPVIDEAVARYSDGDLTAIDRISVLQRSGPFIESAWQALRRTPAGRRTTYTDLAESAGRPEAVRAAAAACAYNAAALFVPCHRIVRRDGGLGGFRYGLETKRQLLAHESAGQIAAGGQA
jgi:methylated-DNA-[protein]-cysteine S-methyltransferase